VVDINIAQDLFDSAGPANLDFFYAAVRSQSKMYPAIARGGISNGRGNFIPLLLSVLGHDVNLGADSHAIAS
jgi:hypothetical protein